MNVLVNNELIGRCQLRHICCGAYIEFNSHEHRHVHSSVDVFYQYSAMPCNGDKLPKLYRSTSNSYRHFQSDSRNSQQQRSKSRSGFCSIDYNKISSRVEYPLNTNSVVNHSSSRSMERDASERNWESEGGRPKSPQGQPIPCPAKKTGFRRLLQRSSLESLIPFQRATRDGSYEKSHQVNRTKNKKTQKHVEMLDSKHSQQWGAKDEYNYIELDALRQSQNKASSNVMMFQDGNIHSSRSKSGTKTEPRNAKSHQRNHVPANPRLENTMHKGSPSLVKLLRRRQTQDSDTSSTELPPQLPPRPLPLSRHSTSIINNRGPNRDNIGSPIYDSRRMSAPAETKNKTEDGLSSRGESGELHSLPSKPMVPPRRSSDNTRNHFTTAREGLVLNHLPRSSSALNAREDHANTTSPRCLVNNDSSLSSLRNSYSTLVDNQHQYSSPMPPPRTSASLSGRDTLLDPPVSRDTQQQPNSIFRQQPFLRQTSTEPQNSPRQRANSEHGRISSARFRSLLSRRGSSGSPRETPELTTPQGTDNRGDDRESSNSNSRSFWRNSFFSRLGSAERRSRSRSESATSSSSNSSQSFQNPTNQSPSAEIGNPDIDSLGFSYGHRPTSRGPGQRFSLNDESAPGLTTQRVVRLTIGPTGSDLGRLLSARIQGGESSNPASGAIGTGSTDDADHLGIQIALMGSPMMSPPVDMATIPPRLLLNFLLQGRRELGNEFVELVLENLLLSILARHMMEVGSQVGGTGAHPPATQEMIDKLAGLIVDQQHIDDDLNCAICHVEYELGEKLSQLPCKHFFHPTCITIWLKKSATCPVCRFKLSRPSENPATGVV